MKIHFAGICGSGQSAIAILAKKNGYEVSGCDLSPDGYYYDSLRKNDIEVQTGHSAKHLEDVDICAVSPALFDVSGNHEEITAAREKGILMTWQQFMGKYLFENKNVIAIAGTHGKSTTTVMLGKLLQELSADPSVISGTIYKEWNSGCRIGESELFVCEADEFNYNFLNYHPSMIVLNNMEMDHPECFASFEEVKGAFSAFLHNLTGNKVLIVNAESSSIHDLLVTNQDWIKENGVKVVGYYSKEKQDFPYDEEICYSLTKYDASGMYFRLSDSETEFYTPLLGNYNLENVMSALSVLRVLQYEDQRIAEALKQFHGINRRFERIGCKNNISVFDDYAHHPTAIRSVLSVCNEIKKGTVWAVFEPHQISRLTLMFDEFTKALGLADRVIITKTHMGREINSGLKPIAADAWIQAIGEQKTEYIESFDDVIAFVCENAKPEDIVLVIGAGESYKISRGILERL